MRDGSAEAQSDERNAPHHLSSSALLQKASLPASATYEESTADESEEKVEASLKQEAQEDSRASGLPLPKVVEQLVKEGTSLQWNSSSGSVPLDGSLRS
eukprot:758640-Hanusia_phi.AAC.3